MSTLTLDQIAQAYEAAEQAYDVAEADYVVGGRLPQESRTDALIADLGLGEYTREQLGRAYDKAVHRSTEGGLFCEADPEMWATEFAEELGLEVR